MIAVKEGAMAALRVLDEVLSILERDDEMESRYGLVTADNNVVEVISSDPTPGSGHGDLAVGHQVNQECGRN